MYIPSIKSFGTNAVFVLATMVFTTLSLVSAFAAPPPVFVAGAQNITCAELRDTNPGGQFGHLVEAWEFKVDTPPNGVNTFRLDGSDGGTLDMPPNSNMWITYDRTSATSVGSWSLSWTFTSAIDRLVSALIIKGGSNGKNIYPYNPLDSSDIGPFITPGQTNAISHISFCFEPFAGPTAADVFVEGRVVGTTGRGLAGITVLLLDGTTGQRKTATTNTFGFFKIEDLEIGNFYVLTATNKRYSFTELSFVPDDNITGLTLVGTPAGLTPR